MVSAAVGLAGRLTEEAFGGLSAGVLGTVIGFPLDMVKTRMQTSVQPSSSMRSSSGGIISIGVGIVRKEGFLALYRGVAAPLLSLSILNTMNFTSYSYFRRLYGADSGWDWRNAMAGASCGPLGAIVSTAENLVKTQMQLDNISKKQYSGSWDCFKSIARSKGVFAGIYTGHLVNTTRETAFLLTYFWTYEGLRNELGERLAGARGDASETQSKTNSSKWAVPVAGGLAGAFSWFVSYPLDCVRAGVQGQDLGSENKKGGLRVFLDLMASKGIRGLYSGVAPSILRAFIVSGSRFSAYETTLWLLRGEVRFAQP